MNRKHDRTLEAIYKTPVQSNIEAQEDVVSKSEYKDLEKRLKEAERVLGKKTFCFQSWQVVLVKMGLLHLVKSGMHFYLGIKTGFAKPQDDLAYLMKKNAALLTACHIQEFQQSEPILFLNPLAWLDLDPCRFFRKYLSIPMLFFEW